MKLLQKLTKGVNKMSTIYACNSRRFISCLSYINTIINGAVGGGMLYQFKS